MEGGRPGNVSLQEMIVYTSEPELVRKELLLL